MIFKLIRGLFQRLVRWLAREERAAPHEQYPEILHWEQDDELSSAAGCYYFISVTADGYVYVWDYLKDHKLKLSLIRVMATATNKNLRDREINKKLKETNEYMELLENFQDAVKELQQRDIQRFGSPQG